MRNACSLDARARISTNGSTNASVLPLPVHASTETSLLPARRPIAAACTGVARWNPCDASTSSDSGLSAGVRALNRGPSALRCLGGSLEAFAPAPAIAHVLKMSRAALLD